MKEEILYPGTEMEARVLIQEGARRSLLIPAGGNEDIPADLSDLPVSIVLLSVRDWNRQLSPWPAAKVMKRGEDFGGGGGAFLQMIETAVIPEAEKLLGKHPWLIAGYSLAGLFALWACTRTSVFEGTACVSGSLWYDGFAEYMADHPCHVRAAALSLGDLESRTRNPVLSRNGERTQAVVKMLEAQGVRTGFAWESGNHFQDPNGRLSRGILSALNLLNP